ncbi:hypothetical protein JTB14_022270 [Gonioctena quinquepunctata]|nr:hypothetical protein JTB14_022270 [Gonioctena quinquepunctata]
MARPVGKVQIVLSPIEGCDGGAEIRVMGGTPSLMIQDGRTRADETYKQKARDKQVAKENENIQCLTLDSQQCLATPFLSNAIAFHKRLLWTYNLTIHDNKTYQAFCYMWHESTAARGANEIALCIFKHIQNLPDGFTKVILYSDTCGGQNENSYVAAMLTLVSKNLHN